MDHKIISYLFVGIVLRLISGEVTNLNDVVDRLNAVEEKLAKIDILFNGLEQFCQTLNSIKSPIEDQSIAISTLKPEESHLSGIDTHGLPNHEEDTPDDHHIRRVNDNERYTEKLELISVESSGVQNNGIEVTVVFTGTDDYIVEWYIGRRDEQDTRLIGHVTKDVVQDDHIRYTVQQTLSDIDTLRSASLMIYSNVYNAFIYFDIWALNDSGIQDIDAVDNEILDYSRNVTVRGEVLETEGFNTTVVVSENVVEALNEKRYYLHLSMDLFNTSATPATLVVISEGRDVSPSVNVKNGSSNELLISLDKLHAPFGGVIMLRIPQNASGYLIGYDYGVEIKVINQDIGDVMPYGTIGVYHQPAFTYVEGPYLSISCMAFGIPLPSLKMYKKGNDRTLRELKADYEIDYSFYNIKTLEFNPLTPTTPEGSYVCQASNGNETVDHEMTYKTFQRVQIDEDKTRLVKNNTKKTVVSCKAKGNPLPEVEIRAHAEYGRNLLVDETRRYTSTRTSKNHVVKVTLVISPPDESISIIYCVAMQSKVYVMFQEAKAIRIRPSKN